MSEAKIILPALTSMQLLILWLVLISAVVALGFGLWLVRIVLAADPGPKSMTDVADAVYEGSMAYLWRQVKTMIPFVVAIALALFFMYRSIYPGWWLPIGIAVAFIGGVSASYGAGYVGMWLAVKGNVRSANAALTSFKDAMELAFKAGGVSGMFTVGLGLLGATIIFLIFKENAMKVLVGFGFGGSLAALFMRVGGGIYTKAADVGGDLVGKVEAGIPEDDPRNAATIADNVGDNVGDCAGMAADLFETYAVTTVATMVLAAIFFAATPILTNMMTLPLAIGGVCIITSIVGTFFVKLPANQSIMGALYRGLIATGALSLVGIALVIWLLIGFGQLPGVPFSGASLFVCGIAGLAVTGLIIWITEYYTGTDFRPVQSIAKASITGHGTNVIQGLAISLEATALPALVIIAGILVTHSLAGLFGIAIAVTTMLALAGMVVALDAFGPVTDNAGGIAEMAGLPKEVRKSTDALDAVGNTTKAVTKGYAIGSAGLGALVLFAAYNQDLQFFIANATPGSYFDKIQLNFSLTNPYVVVGLLFGGLLPYLFGAMGMTAVGRAAGAIVEEVRR